MESIRNEFPEKNICKLMNNLIEKNVNFTFNEDTEDKRKKRVQDTNEMITELCYLMIKYDISVNNVPKEICEKVRKRFSKKSVYETVKETLGLASECVSKVVSDDFMKNICNALKSVSREIKVSEFMRELCEFMHKCLYSDVLTTFSVDAWRCFLEELSKDIHRYIIFSAVFNTDDYEAENMSRDIPYVNPLDYSNFEKWWLRYVGGNGEEMDKKYLDIAVKTLFSFCPIPICMDELGKVSYHLIVNRATEACRELHEKIHDSERYWDIDIPE